MRLVAVYVALGLLLGAAPSYAQAPQPATPAQAGAVGAKFAFINVQRVASESAEGKTSTAKVQGLQQQKIAQLNDLNKKLQENQQKLQSQSSVLNDAARGQLEREIDRQQKEVQRTQQDAQEEIGNLQKDLQDTFQQKLLPVIQQLVQERGIQVLFSEADAGVVLLADRSLDITPEVIKRFDAAHPAGAGTTMAPTTPPPATAAPAASTPKPPAPKPPPAKPPVR
jgi:outer membrane protein